MKDFSFVYSSKPVNSTAAKVMSRGEHFEPDIIPENHLYSDNPPIMIEFNGPKEHNLIGEFFGYFKVVGYLKHKKKIGGIWVIKCKCGKYGNRRASFLKKYSIENKNDYQCDMCRFQEKIKTPEYKNRYDGKMKDIKLK